MLPCETLRYKGITFFIGKLKKEDTKTERLKSSTTNS